MKRLFNTAAAKLAFHIFDVSSDMFTLRTLFIRVADVAREHGWHPPKSFDSDKNFKPEHALLCRELRFIAIYAPFGDLWANYMVYIAYFTELILQIWDYTQKRRI